MRMGRLLTFLALYGGLGGLVSKGVVTEWQVQWRSGP